MVRLQETGGAALSDTVIGGRHRLRAAICNHRTRDEDLELLVADLSRFGTPLSPRDGYRPLQGALLPRYRAKLEV